LKKALKKMVGKYDLSSIVSYYIIKKASKTGFKLNTKPLLIIVSMNE
jgi:hypothetical protein